jgi:hypothetical protein
VQSRAVVTVALLVALGIGFALGILGSKLFPPRPTTIHGEEVFNLRQCINHQIPGQLRESVRLFDLKTPEQRAISYLLLESTCVNLTVGGVDPGGVQRESGLVAAPDKALLK